MILKLCNPGATRYVECVDIFHQVMQGPYLDVEAVSPKGESIRFIVGRDDQPYGRDSGTIWARAYVMENGKTVDTIKPPEYAVTTSTSSSSGSPRPAAE